MSCAILSLLFFLFGIVFMVLKEKAALLLSGFNALSKEERAQYDQVKMSRDQRNAFFLWAIILAMGYLCSLYMTKYCSYIALMIWLILFLKDVHLDVDKAFGKYKKIMMTIHGFGNIDNIPFFVDTSFDQHVEKPFSFSLVMVLINQLFHSH